MLAGIPSSSRRSGESFERRVGVVIRLNSRLESRSLPALKALKSDTVPPSCCDVIDCCRCGVRGDCWLERGERVGVVAPTRRICDKKKRTSFAKKCSGCCVTVVEAGEARTGLRRESASGGRESMYCFICSAVQSRYWLNSGSSVDQSTTSNLSRRSSTSAMTSHEQLRRKKQQIARG